MLRASLVALVLLAACGGGARPAPTTPGTATAGEPQPGDAAAVSPQASGKVRAPLVCNTDDDEAARLYNEGNDHVAAGDVAAAERVYLAAIARDPEFCDAMDNLAVQYRRTDRVAEAIALYQRSVAIAPHNQLGWQNLGVAFWKSGRLDEAAQAYQRLIDLDPRNPEGWFGSGQVAIMAGRHADAKTALVRAEALYVERGAAEVDDARMLLGILAGGTRDWPNVRKYLEPLYPRVQQFPDANLVLGEAYLQPDANDPAKARTYLERARALGAQVPADLWRRANP